MSVRKTPSELYYERTARSPIFSFHNSVYPMVRFHLLPENGDIRVGEERSIQSVYSFPWSSRSVRTKTPISSCKQSARVGNVRTCVRSTPPGLVGKRGMVLFRSNQKDLVRDDTYRVCEDVKTQRRRSRTSHRHPCLCNHRVLSG